MTFSPYLTFVVASRNDDHGGDLLKRMQVSIHALAYQVEKYQIPSELLIVEWNPHHSHAPLEETLIWPRSKFLSIKIITVPNEIHQRLCHDGPLDFYQMIAKNVGIRRAKGDFILVTNVDILFSNLLMEEISKKNLRKNTLYRCDRLDVDNKIPIEQSVEDQLKYCQKNVLRVSNKFGTWKIGAEPNSKAQGLTSWQKKYQRLKTLFYATFDKRMRKAEYLGLLDDFIGQFRKVVSLHTNACGDFTLMDRESWLEVGGYPELVMYSFHMDSLYLHLAFAKDKKMHEWPPEMVTYHIEHGGGWTPESESKLFESQLKKGSYTLKYGTYLKWAQKIADGDRSLVKPNWGLYQVELKTVEVSKQKPLKEEAWKGTEKLPTEFLHLPQ